MKNKQSGFGEGLQVPSKSTDVMNEHCDWYSIWEGVLNYCHHWETRGMLTTLTLNTNHSQYDQLLSGSSVALVCVISSYSSSSGKYPFALYLTEIKKTDSGFVLAVGLHLDAWRILTCVLMDSQVCQITYQFLQVKRTRPAIWEPLLLLWCPIKTEFIPSDVYSI